MYYYIYDSFLNQGKYAAELNRIEARLMDLGINGRIEKLTILKSFKEIVEEAIRKGAKTIIAVGNDQTVSKIISYLPNLQTTLGIIPIGEENNLASLLGIPSGEQACDTLSSRIIEKIDLGKANNKYFISSLQVPVQKELVMDCGSYKISPLDNTKMINICNFSSLPVADNQYETCGNPKDGMLEAIISSNQKEQHGLFGLFKKEYSKKSVFPIKKMKIKCSSESLSVLADGQTTIKTPLTVEVIPKKLKIIVGKKRMF